MFILTIFWIAWIAFIFLILYFIFYLVQFIDMIKNQKIKVTEKGLWTIAFLIFPLTAIIWLIVKQNKK